ncbi:MAG: diacylglycerol/lipid kinase family protein, partial [Sphingobacteriia bacterium]
QQIAQYARRRRWELQLIRCGRGLPPTDVALAEALSTGADLVIAAGGDGTLHHTARQLAHTGVPMAILPLGTGNGIARHYGIPLRLGAALALLGTGQVRPVDMGRMNEQLFMGFMGMGLDARVAHRFEREQGRRSFRRYLWLSLRERWHYQPQAVRLHLPDGQQLLLERPLLVNVAVTTQFGSGARIAPAASATDGLLELCVLHQHPLLLGLPLAIRLFRGTLPGSRYYQHWPVPQVEIELLQKTLLQLDGELLLSTHKTLRFSCLRGALQLLLPAGQKA